MADVKRADVLAYLETAKTLLKAHLLLSKKPYLKTAQKKLKQNLKKLELL